jgi:hypothetical protein
LYSPKVKKQLRARGGGAESTPQKGSTGSPESSTPSSGRVQSGLGKFLAQEARREVLRSQSQKNWYLRKGKGSADFSRMP